MSRRLLLSLLICFCAGVSQAATKPNIFLITLDSTRADAMGFLGAHKNATPNLDAAAAEAIVFEHAYAQAPLSVPSHATILTGLYPQTHQVAEVGMPLPASVPFLPDLLHARGYRTAAFVGSSELDPRAGFAPGFARGFDVYEAPRAAGQPEVALAEFAKWRAEEVMRRAIGWLPQQSGAPVFVWVSLYRDAGPAYGKQVTGLDAAVGKLIQTLKERKLYDDAIIIIAAENGEALGAHGEHGHGIFLYDDTIHVPLLVKLPHSQLAGRKLTTRVSLVDVAPSVLEAVGVAVPPQMQGQSLLRIVKARSAADQPVYSRTDVPSRDFGWSALESWRARNYLLIRAPHPELYDLSADPGAAHNLADSRKAVLETLSAQLENFDHRLSPGSSANSAGLTSSELQKLSSLGYVGLQRPASREASSPTGTDPKDEIAVADRVQDAMTMLRSGKPAPALAALESVAASHSNAYLAFYGAGLAQIALNQYKAAIESLHKAITLRPDSVLAHYAMGFATSRTGDWKTAATHLEIVIARWPESPRPHELLSQAYSHLGRESDSAREKAKASQLQHS